MPITLRDYQQDVVNKVYNSWNAGNRNVCLVMDTGLGKCHGVDTPILMFDGTIKKVQDIQPGDFVMGPDSQPRFVVNTTRGYGQLYKIKPIKGDSFVVNSEHILSLKRTAKIQNDPRKGEIVNIPVKDYLQQNRTFKHIHKQWRTPINFTEKKVEFDPYMLGLWLGDGSSNRPQITNPEPEIIFYCIDFASKHDMNIRFYQKPNNKAVEMFFSRKEKYVKKPSYFMKFLRDYNLFNNKHIPLEYKTACREDRLKLLAGILDTDGSLSHNGFDLIFKSETLLDDTMFLTRSLGLACYKKPCLKTCTNTGAIGIYYRCNIQGDCSIIPTQVERKKAYKRGQIKDVLMTGFKVEDIGFGDYYGFEVVGNDRLYVLGDFTVTHNSVCMSSIALDFHKRNQHTAVVAHRNELVSQMSGHLAKAGIPHRIIAPTATVGQIIHEHRDNFGKSFVNPSSLTAVVGVDTLVSRADSLKNWAQQISLWEIDENHHNCRYNKWGKAVEMFINARGLGVTATPNRADGKGIGRWADGFMDDMVKGPSMRWAIDNGYLSDYEIVCPKSDLNVEDSPLSSNGDWSVQTLKKAAKKSKIVGDVVKNYLKYANGRRAIVFATDIETAEEIAGDFRASGIEAVSLNGKTAAPYRKQSVELFKTGKIQVLVNVDLFDEGFDLPACDVVIMARPTASLAKFLQQCLDDETEILTKRGWLSRKEVLNTDIVAGFNTTTEEIEWCDILEKIERPVDENEKMFSFSNQHLNFRVTGGHNMVVRSRSETSINWLKQDCETVYNRSTMFHVPVAGKCYDEDNKNITDDEIRFLGWFLTDGTLNKHTHQIILSQSMKHEEYRKNIENVLNNCGFKYGVYIVKRKGKWEEYQPDVRYAISYGKPKGTKKHLRGWQDLEPWIDRNISEIYNTLSHRQLKILLETMKLGDGSKRKNLDYNEHSICLCTGDHILKTDRLQSLCVRKGFRCNKSFQQREKNKTYYLHIKEITTSSIAGKNVKNGKISNKKEYKRARIQECKFEKNEIVWCVRNRLGTLVTRRNGKVIIVGNCGRALRPLPGKTALIIDHVSNVIRHGLPDMEREWTLNRRERRAKSQADPSEISLTVCKNCLKPYEKFRTVCPYCGFEKPLPEPQARSIEMVEGDLVLLTREMLERMRRGTVLESPADIAARVNRVAGPIAAKGVANRQAEKIAAQADLKEAIAQWAAIERLQGFDDREIYKKFYLTTGLDVLSALDGSHSRQEFEDMANRIKEWWK